MEEITVNGDTYHSNGCFKCATCKVTLTMSNFAALDGVNYCKPHFKQLFKRKGSYKDINPEGLDTDVNGTNRKSLSMTGPDESH